MVLAILLIGLTLEETLHLYSLTLLEEIEERLVIILDPGLEALDGRRGNLHPTLLPINEAKGRGVSSLQIALPVYPRLPNQESSLE